MVGRYKMQENCVQGVVYYYTFSLTEHNNMVWLHVVRTYLDSRHSAQLYHAGHVSAVRRRRMCHEQVQGATGAFIHTEMR